MLRLFIFQVYTKLHILQLQGLISKDMTISLLLQLLLNLWKFMAVEITGVRLIISSGKNSKPFGVFGTRREKK